MSDKESRQPLISFEDEPGNQPTSTPASAPSAAQQNTAHKRAPEAESELPEDVFRELKQLDGNKACFDCGTKDTQWAALPYGIFLCIQCAGKHRELGVHISMVRSLTLDRWPARNLAYMRRGGNDAARHFFTENLIMDNPDKYHSKPASEYRDIMRRLVSEEFGPEPAPAPAPPPSDFQRRFEGRTAISSADFEPARGSAEKCVCCSIL